MKKSNKANDFLILINAKQELDKKIQNRKKINSEKPMNGQEVQKFKTEIFQEIRDFLPKMLQWANEGGISKEEISFLLTNLKGKKDEEINTAFEDAKQTYVNEVHSLNFYKYFFKLN